MKQSVVKEIIECLGGERRVFNYFNGRHWLDRVEHIMTRHCIDSIRFKDLKQYGIPDLFQIEAFKDKGTYFGNGILAKEDVQQLIPREVVTTVLDLSCWGDGDRGWDQTTRNQSNIVLRLNFPSSVTSEYHRLVKPTDRYGPFEYWGHPVSKGQRKTVSWVRIDLDFDTNEALIEEIQNDWLRKAVSTLKTLKHRIKKDPSAKPAKFNPFIGGSLADMEMYVEEILAPYRKVWAEASLCAAIDFIRRDLGIDNIYYHSFETGMKLKRVEGEPPKSIYTKLPRKFGFERVSQAPKFILADKKASRYLKAIKESAWHYLV